MGVRDVYQLPLAAQSALRAGVDFLDRLPEIERAISEAAQGVRDVLDRVLERIEPIEMKLQELKSEGEDLRSELVNARGDLSGLDERIEALALAASRLEGSLEHVFDRIPGLSAEKAQEQGREVAARTGS